MTARNPKPTALTRAEVEAMIAEAVAAERARNDQALAGVMLALGGAAQAMGEMADALMAAGDTLDRHSTLLEPMAAAFAAGVAMEDAAEAPAETAPN